MIRGGGAKVTLHDMIFERRTEFYTLCKDHNGHGSSGCSVAVVGMYLRRLKLNSEEIGMIGEWGDYYLGKIALDIAKEPARFEERLKEQ
jgi:hypothetical protein